MEDPVLNRSLEETRELQTRWNQFRDFIRMAIERGKATPEAEMKFLELKSFIAMLHDGFMSKLDHDQKTGQNIMSIVGDCIMLKRICGYNDAEKQKFEFDWNECYLLIGEQVAQLDAEKNRLAAIKESSYKAGKMKEKIVAAIYNFFHSAGLKWAMIFGGLVIGLFIVPEYVYSYRNFAKIPGVDKVYFFVADKLFRPILNSDYAYDRWEDLNADPDAPHETFNGRIKREDASALTMDSLKSSVINEIGMSRQNSDEAKGLLTNNVLHFESERFTVDSTDARFYYTLFDTTKNAKRFMELEELSLKDPALSEGAKDKIRTTVYVKRLANFVAVSISNHQMRADQIVEKFRLNKDKYGETDLKF